MKGSWELFDLTTDRTEQHNLADSQTERVAELRKEWQAWAKAANVMPKPAQKKKKKK